jgi:protease I
MFYKISLLLLLFVTPAFAQKSVLMMVPNDFMWPEYSEPMNQYKQAGFKVVVAAKFKEATHPDRRNKAEFAAAKEIMPDLSFEEVVVDNFDAITFVAGNGAWHDFFPNQNVHKILGESMKKGKVIGLLCASTGLLGFVDNLDGKGQPIAEGRKATGYFRVEGILRELGKVKYISGGQKEPGVVVDGNLITGRNPESSKIFGEAVVRALK